MSVWLRDGSSDKYLCGPIQTNNRLLDCSSNCAGQFKNTKGNADENLDMDGDDEGNDEIISPASYAPSCLFGKDIDDIDS